MAQSLSNILLHLVFSTKDRRPMIEDHWRDDLHRYIGGILHECGGTLIGANSVRDHVHLLFDQPRKMPVSQVVQSVKGGSSHWIHSSVSPGTDFRWQRGYGIFTVGISDKIRTMNYISNQQEHHRSKSFQEEYRQLLADNEILFDERYVWD
jgi:putative transposase